MFQPVSTPLQDSIRFLQILRPHTHQHALRFACPDWSGRIYRVSTFHLVTFTDDLDSSRTPVEQHSRMATLESHILSTHLLVQASVCLARFFLTTLQMFACADLIIQSQPSPESDYQEGFHLTISSPVIKTFGTLLKGLHTPSSARWQHAFP